MQPASRERLAALRSRRDNARVAELRSQLESVARHVVPGAETAKQAPPSSAAPNLMPVFIDCVENDVTLGEICNTLRGVWGEYQAHGF